MLYYVKETPGGSFVTTEKPADMTGFFEVEDNLKEAETFLFTLDGEIVKAEYPRLEAEEKVDDDSQTISNLMESLSASLFYAASNEEVESSLVASSIGLSVDYLDAIDWSVGITTAPGDIVWDPDRKYRYVFKNPDSMTHSNPLFYPGSTGVYYWAIIPNLKDNIKIYPDVSGIIVAVKKNEVWWNTSKDKQYKWVGEDNPNCVWAPGTAPTMWEEV